jgi:hypothetical protein
MTKIELQIGRRRVAAQRFVMGEITSTVTTRQGLIGFFDILGYSSFLENNSAADAARVVVDVLQNLRTEVGSIVCEQAKDENRTVPAELLNDLRWLVFSDSVLLTLPYTPQCGSTENIWSWLAFLSHAQLLHKYLFNKGLPIRGAITAGEYFVQEACFAGRGIVDAYNDSQSLDLSAVVICLGAISELDAVAETGYPMSLQAFTADYLTPFRDGTQSLRRIVKTDATLSEASDVRQQVFESFTRYKKDLPAKALSKLTNTELLFRFCRSRKG